MTIEKTLADRGDRYGSFQNHANISQALQDIMRSEAGWERLAADQRQALTVIADKIARMLNGDPTYRDNWHDIVGYAKLVDDRMAADEAKRVSPTAKEAMEAGFRGAFQAAITELVDGWKPWTGGERPGTAETKFDLRTRNGQELFGVMTGEMSWRHSGHEHDIVAYRECKPAEAVLPNGLSWDMAPRWANLLIRHKEDGDLCWCETFEDNARVKVISGRDNYREIVNPERWFEVIGQRT